MKEYQWSMNNSNKNYWYTSGLQYLSCSQLYRTLSIFFFSFTSMVDWLQSIPTKKKMDRKMRNNHFSIRGRQKIFGTLVYQFFSLFIQSIPFFARIGFFWWIRLNSWCCLCCCRQLFLLVAISNFWWTISPSSSNNNHSRFWSSIVMLLLSNSRFSEWIHRFCSEIMFEPIRWFVWLCSRVN